LKDAVAVLERKIQILDRKGFFGTLPGRRRALDRLLPTIRAATDPITRELYLSRAAEAAGVRKDVLERETGNEKREAVRAPTFPVSRVPFPALPASAEKALVLLMLEGEPWKSRVVEAVDPEQLEQLDDQLPFESPERQVSLIAEKRRVFDELRKRYPRYKIAKRRRGAPGT